MNEDDIPQAEQQQLEQLEFPDDAESGATTMAKNEGHYYAITTK